LHVTLSLLIKDAFLSYSLLTAVVSEQNDFWHVVKKQVNDLNCKLGKSVTVLFLEEVTLMRYDLVVWSPSCVLQATRRCLHHLLVLRGGGVGDF
jgi:hypothetical protein